MDRYLGESDWDDLDLITTDEAVYRFDEEIAELTKQIEAGAGDLAAARRRLDVLLDAKARLRRPRTGRPKE